MTEKKIERITASSPLHLLYMFFWQFFSFMLLADVKQYGNLINTLSFLLKSYKPKASEAVSGKNDEQNGTFFSLLVCFAKIIVHVWYG